MLFLCKDQCENITPVSEGPRSITFSFAFGIFCLLKHCVNFRIKELKVIHSKSNLRLEDHIWLEPWQNLKKKILQIGAIDTEPKESLFSV